MEYMTFASLILFYRTTVILNGVVNNQNDFLLITGITSPSLFYIFLQS